MCRGGDLVCVWGMPAGGWVGGMLGERRDDAQCVLGGRPDPFPHRNWCAYVVTRSVSCVVEDGVESFVKADYQPCGWGQLQCPRVLA